MIIRKRVKHRLVLLMQKVSKTQIPQKKKDMMLEKVSGIKLHIAVDTLGLPHAIHITCANITDRKGAETMVVLHLEDPSSISNFLVDGGYSGEKFARAISEIHGASVEVVKRNVIIVISQQTAKDRKLSSLLVFHPVRIQSTTG